MSNDNKDKDVNELQDGAVMDMADQETGESIGENDAGQDAGAGQKKAETRIAKGNFRDTIRAVAGGYVAYLGIRILRDLEPIDRTPSKMIMPILFIIFGGIVCYISLKSYFKTAKAITNGTYDNVDEHGNPIVEEPVPVKKTQAPLAKSSASIADRAKAAAAYAVSDDDTGEDTSSDDDAASDHDSDEV